MTRLSGCLSYEMLLEETFKEEATYSPEERRQAIEVVMASPEKQNIVRSF